MQWLWPTLVQKELDQLRDRFNAHKVRYDKNKILPSGVSPNVAYALLERYNAVDCLQVVDRHVVRGIMDAMGGDDLIRFVDIEFAVRAQNVFNSLNLPTVTLDNVWYIFQAMMPVLYPR